MKKLSITAATIAGCLAGMPVHAAVSGFIGPYGAGQWTQTITGDLPAGSGGSTALAPASLVIVGGDAVSSDPPDFVPACTGASFELAGPCQISFTTTNIASPFVFDWSYTTADSDGPGADIFGVLIDGVATPLSDLGGADSQSGHAEVSATTSFGWYINCTDCIEGAATASITNFVAGTVPEPGSMALLGLGAAGLAATGVRRRRGECD